MKKYYIAPELEVEDAIAEEQLLAASVIGTDVSGESAEDDETALAPMFGWGTAWFE